MPPRTPAAGGPILVYGEKLREQVERTSSGGGAKFHPRSPEQARELLRPQARDLQEEVERLPESLRGRRVVFQATLLPNYLAASYFPAQLFELLDLVPIGSRAATAVYETKSAVRDDVRTKSVIVAGTSRSFERLGELLERGGTSRSERSAAEQFREFSEIRLPTEGEILGSNTPSSDTSDLPMWEAVLHPGAASRGPSLVPVEDDTFAKWVRYIHSLGGEVVSDYRRAVGGLTFVPVRLGADLLSAAAQFNPLRSIRPMPAMRPITPGLIRSIGVTMPPPATVTPQTSLRVAVFDGGVDVSGGMYPTCTPIDLTAEPAAAHLVSHGSVVTAAALYGNVTTGSALDAPAANIDHFRVLPNPDPATDPDAYWVLDRIVESVEVHPYPVVNLSLGPAISVEDTEEPNRWTSTLDQLAYERDILFVTAAGNNGEEDPATGLDRVQVPADMANGLSVGACDHHAPTTPFCRAPYSAVGPGRTGSRVQPTGVQFGGDTGNLFRGVLGDGTIVETAGTSFAAPLVTHSFARLAAVLGESRAVPNNCRALSVHLADRDDSAEVREIGHGRFQPHFDDSLQCGPNEILVLYEDEIARDEVVSLALPLPDGISGNIEIAWTLSLLAPTEPTQPTEYTQATIDLVFRPHDQRFRFSRGSSSTIVNVVEDAERAADLYANEYTAGSVPASFAMPGTSGTEEERRDGGKWETLRHFRKTFRASSLRNPRLELAYIAREGGLLTHNRPPIDYSLVVSARARHDVDLYERARNEFPLLTPVDIALRQEARTTV